MRRAAVAAAFVLQAGPAQAHVVIEGVGGFPGGLLHPLLVPSHTLTLIALGLLTGSFPTWRRIALLAAFAAAALSSFALIAMAYSATQPEMVVLCLAAVTGLLLAAGLIPPYPVAMVLAIAIAVAIMFDSVPQVLTVSETALALAGSVLAALALVATTAWLSGTLPQRVRHLGIRIAGSWIAASAVMVLALRIAG